MLRLILFFISLALISLGIGWFSENKGNITVEWPGYQIEASVFFAVTSISVLFVILFLLLQFLLFLKSLPARLRDKRIADRKDRVLIEVTKGLAAIAVEDRQNARRSANEIVKLASNKPIAHIISAQVAHLEGDRQKEQEHLSALLGDKTTELAAVKGMLAAAVKDGNMDKAIEFAEKAHKLRPGVESTSKGLLELYKRTGKWDEAQLFLERHSKKNLWNIIRRKKSAIDLDKEKSGLLYLRAKKLADENNYEKAAELLSSAIKLRPDFSAAVILYADMLLKLGKKGKASASIERIWKVAPNNDLADKYFEIHNRETGARKLKLALKLLSLNKPSWYSHIVVAKIALEVDNLNMARNHLRQAAEVAETISICNLMADIEKSDGVAKEVIEQWQSKAATALPDPVWQCANCGRRHDKWNMLCSYCNSLDSISQEKIAAKPVAIITNPSGG